MIGGAIFGARYFADWAENQSAPHTVVLDRATETATGRSVARSAGPTTRAVGRGLGVLTPIVFSHTNANVNVPLSRATEVATPRGFVRSPGSASTALGRGTGSFAALGIVSAEGGVARALGRAAEIAAALGLARAPGGVVHAIDRATGTWLAQGTSRAGANTRALDRGAGHYAAEEMDLSASSPSQDFLNLGLVAASFSPRVVGRSVAGATRALSLATPALAPRPLSASRGSSALTLDLLVATFMPRAADLGVTATHRHLGVVTAIFTANDSAAARFVERLGSPRTASTRHGRAGTTVSGKGRTATKD